MGLDYTQIGKRIARKRKFLRLTQAEVAERADIGEKYLSSIERAKSIPSTEVVMRLSIALGTTPDEFLVGTARYSGEEWKSVAEKLRPLNGQKLELVSSFIDWAAQQDI